MSYHQTIIEGNVGQDPEQKYLPSGDAVTNFSVAVTDSWKDKKTGEKKEVVTWYRINTFGPLAEVCGQWLRKGSHVLIVGKMQAREWEKDGVKRTSWELKADVMRMLGSKGDAAPAAAPVKAAQAQPAGHNFADMPDEIPY